MWHDKNKQLNCYLDNKSWSIITNPTFGGLHMMLVIFPNATYKTARKNDDCLTNIFCKLFRILSERLGYSFSLE